MGRVVLERLNFVSVSENLLQFAYKKLARFGVLVFPWYIVLSSTWVHPPNVLAVLT